jgi:hypothetical protein
MIINNIILLILFSKYANGNSLRMFYYIFRNFLKNKNLILNVMERDKLLNKY